MSRVKVDKLPLEFIKTCSLCGSTEANVVLSGIRDNVSCAVDYDGEIFQCCACGHAFLSPIISHEKLHLAYKGYYTHSQENLSAATNARRDRFSFFKEFYDYCYKGASSKRGGIIFTASLIVPFSKFFLFRAVRFLPVPLTGSKPKLLDVGCGRGDFLMRAAHCGYDVTGIDFDPGTIAIACARGLNAFVSEVHNLSESEVYDAIILSHVVEHVSDPVALIKHIYRRLKPGGYFYISTPNFNSSGRKVFAQDWRGIDAPRHMHFFNTRQLENVLLEAGFSSVEQVCDLPQSVGVLRSSFRLSKIGGASSSKLIGTFFKLLKNRPYFPSYLEVTVFKCYR